VPRKLLAPTEPHGLADQPDLEESACCPVHDYSSTPLDPLLMSIGFYSQRLFLIETLLQLIYNLETRFQGNKHP